MAAGKKPNELYITRVFDAPRTLVFDAFTKPHLVQRWLLGPDGWSMPSCERNTCTCQLLFILPETSSV